MPQLEVEIVQVGPSTSKGVARSHSVLIDRPVAKGGADRGPLGGEYLLMGFGGCFMSNLLAAINARQAPVQDVRIVVTGTIGGSPDRFTELNMKIAARCDDQDLMQKLIAISERSCIVTNTLREHMPITITYEGII